MRGGLLAGLLLLAGCHPGVPQPPDSGNKNEQVGNKTEQVGNTAAAPAPANETEAENPAGPPVALEPPARDPGLATMSPYRRREYERGYRDCMTGNFDRERQGESYRIGCMAAEEARERRSR